MDRKQLEEYWRDGFVVLRRLFEPASLDRWLERLDGIVSGSVEPAKGMLLMKDVMVAKGAVVPGSRAEAIAKVQDFENDPILSSYLCHPRIVEAIAPIVGNEPWSIHTMLINKPPNVDGRHPLHQDLLYFPFRPADRIVATWTALERVTKENGCLVVVPGSHRGELLEHANPDWEWVNGGYFGVKDIGDALEDRVHLEMEPGDTVFFHPVLLHGSGRNRTQGFRRAISAHYTALDVEWAWNTDQAFNRRKYRILRGDRAGELWDGPRRRSGSVNPLDYLPFGKKS